MSIFNKKLAEQIPKRKESIIPPQNGSFEVIFSDKSKAHEKDYSWNDLSDYVTVDFMGRPRVVKLCKYQIKSITVQHQNVTTTIEPEDGDRVYTSIRSMATHSEKNIILGRVVGVVRNGKVIEEKFIGPDDVQGIKLYK